MLRRICIACILCCLSSALPVKAQVSTGPLPNWLFGLHPDQTKQPLQNEISNGYYLELVDKQTNVASQEDYVHLIRHIVNETGVQNASELSVTFSPQYQKVIFHQLSLIRDGKVISKLNASQIKVVEEENESGNFLYNGNKRAFIILKDVRPNDRIDAAYTIKGFNPVFGGKFSDEFYFYAGTAVSNYFQTIITTKTHPLQFRYFNQAPSPRRFHHDDTLMYFWQDPPYKSVESNNNPPSWYFTTNLVSVTEYSSWKEVAEWGLGLFQNYTVPLSATVNKKIADFKERSKGDQEVYISLATRFVQDQVRYLGMETGIYSHRPHDPGQVCSQLFGDCKDKAFLLAMILRANNIKSYVALANTDFRSGLATQNPSPTKFNHVIVAIEKGSDLQFIDATISYQRGPARDLSIPDYGYVLVLKPGITDLSPVHLRGQRSTEIKENLSVNYAGNGPSKLEVVTSYTGGAANEMRQTLSASSLNDVQKNFKQFYAKIYDSIEQEKDIAIIDDTIKNRLQVFEYYSIPNVWSDDGKGNLKIGTYAHPFANSFPNPTERYTKGPLSLSYPQQISYKLQMNMPEEWTLTNDEYHIDNRYLKFDFRINKKNKVILLDYDFESHLDNIPEESIAAYRKDYRDISSVIEYNIFRNPGKPAAGSETSVSLKEGVNLMGVMAMILTILFMVMAFLHVNKTSVPTQFIPGTGHSIGGWLIVPALTLVVSAVVLVYSFFSTSFFSLSMWHNAGQLAGTSLQAVILLEIILNTAMIGYVLALNYWFFKKRDIFPLAFISFLIAKIIVLILDICMISSFNLNNDTSDSWVTIFRLMIYSAIWIPYFLRADRVKETFIEPWKIQVPPNEMQTIPANNDGRPAGWESGVTEDGHLA